MSAVPVDFTTFAPWYLLGKYVGISYAISWIGSMATLELLRRRTSRWGLYNYYCLVASALSMGGIAIWSMHFVGNRAIVLYDGSRHLQLAYSPGFTALSFFVPVLVLLLAYYVIGVTQTKVSMSRVLPGSAFAGAAIIGMHYIGQAGIANYYVSYKTGYVVGSVVVALVACAVAFTTFFVLHARWSDALWKRVIIAIILAGAVSGMHWCATFGTSYRYIPNGVAPGSPVSRDATVIVVLVMTVAGTILLVLFAYFAGRRHIIDRKRARELVLASATFDPAGRLMVTLNGNISSRRITDAYYGRDDEKLFASDHRDFHWIYRASWNWGSVKNLISGMRLHIRTVGHQTEDVEYSVLFREMFCIAAQDLADSFREHLENVGVLYDRIVQTGVRNTPNSEAEDEENFAPTNSKGQFLFLVRQASESEAARLMANGFRFADIGVASEILSKSMQVQRTAILENLANMRRQANVRTLLAPGVYLTCFSIKASVKGDFQILVREKARNLLPTMQLPLEYLESWQSEFIQAQAGKTVGEILQHMRLLQMERTGREEQHFFTQFHGALASLSQDINRADFQHAVLVPRQVVIPSQLYTSKGLMARLIVFRMVVPIHTPINLDASSNFTYIPLGLFEIEQKVGMDARDDEAFMRQVHREFSGVIDVKYRPPPPASRLLRAAPRFQYRKRDLQHARQAAIPSNPFENILVSQSVSVCVSDESDDANGYEMDGLEPSANQAEAFFADDSRGWVGDILAEFKPFKSDFKP